MMICSIGVAAAGQRQVRLPAALGDGDGAAAPRNGFERIDFRADLGARCSVAGSRSIFTARIPVVVAVSNTRCGYSVERPNAATRARVRR